MRDDAALCAHLRGDRPSLTIASSEILDWYDGPISAVARCADCGGLALVEMLDWSHDQGVRIYAAAGLGPEPLAVYRRNAGKATCDAGRLQRETDALIACAGPVERLLALAMDGYAVTGTASAPDGLALPSAPLAERLPPLEDASWFSRLGLQKAAAGTPRPHAP
jgi:hypothetical protein